MYITVPRSKTAQNIGRPPPTQPHAPHATAGPLPRGAAPS